MVKTIGREEVANITIIHLSVGMSYDGFMLSQTHKICIRKTVKTSV